ncbi:hypothetical protein [Halopseudomonas bauzanensis]|nr:hypothetical protein [Halopseudomonas bauzanensis]
MKSVLSVGVLGTALLLSGCIVSEEEHRKLEEKLDMVQQELRSTQQALGQFRYMALDPELEFSLSDQEFSDADNKYSSPTVKFKANLRQTNNDFPLDNYEILIGFSVLANNDQEISEFTVNSTVKNGVLALAEEKSLYSLKNRSLEGLRLTVKDYAWYPTRSFEPK